MRQPDGRAIRAVSDNQCWMSKYLNPMHGYISAYDQYLKKFEGDENIWGDQFTICALEMLFGHPKAALKMDNRSGRYGWMLRFHIDLVVEGGPEWRIGYIYNRIKSVLVSFLFSKFSQCESGSKPSRSNNIETPSPFTNPIPITRTTGGKNRGHCSCMHTGLWCWEINRLLLSRLWTCPALRMNHYLWQVELCLVRD